MWQLKSSTLRSNIIKIKRHKSKSENCKVNPCGVDGCQLLHNHTLHSYFSTKAESANSVERVSHEEGRGQVNVSSYACNVMKSRPIARPIVSVYVNGSHDVVYCLQDSGSTNTFVSKRLVDKLHLNGNRIETNMTTPNGVFPLTSESVSLNIESVQNGNKMTLSNVIVLPVLNKS